MHILMWLLLVIPIIWFFSRPRDISVAVMYIFSAPVLAVGIGSMIVVAVVLLLLAAAPIILAIWLLVEPAKWPMVGLAGISYVAVVAALAIYLERQSKLAKEVRARCRDSGEQEPKWVENHFRREDEARFKR